MKDQTLASLEKERSKVRESLKHLDDAISSYLKSKGENESVIVATTVTTKKKSHGKFSTARKEIVSILTEKGKSDPNRIRIELKKRGINIQPKKLRNLVWNMGRNGLIQTTERGIYSSPVN